MRIHRLRNKLLLSAFVISVMTALAYMAAASWVIRQQYLDQSQATLKKASSVISDNLAERQGNLLMAARQLATQRNLGATIWYLEQYAHADLDRETLFNTYLQLARETRKTGYGARASRIAIYNSAGNLVAFARFDGKQERVGFVESAAEAKFQVAELQSGGEITAAKLRTSHAEPRISASLGTGWQQQDAARFAVVDGLMSIEACTPIMDESFDQHSGKPETKQVGLVVLVQALDSAFVNQLSRLTDTDINVFTGQGLSSGSLGSYRQPMRKGGMQYARTAAEPMLLNQISINGLGYYQGLIPLYSSGKLVGNIATLRSKATVEKTIGEMIWTLWLIAVACLALVIPFAWYFATSIARPLTTLSRILRGAARDERVVVLDEELGLLDQVKTQYGEVGDLTQSFIAMNDVVNQKIRQINQINASLESTVNQRTAALAAKEQESRTLIENSPDTVARYDSECRCIYVNPAFCIISGSNADELLGTRPTENPGGPNADIYETKIREVLANGVNQHFEQKWAGKDGQDICSHICLTAEVDISGNVATVLAVGRDISDRIEFEQVIWKQANFDTLTRLPNRQMFHDRLQHEAKVTHRTGKPMILMLIDLDHFKEINDSLGHDKGDILLIEAARRISACVRESDTVARLGGSDEAFISASIGITFYPNDTNELDALLKHADQAMYVAKSAGRNRFSYFTPDLQALAQLRLRLTSDLRAALTGNQLQVYYQPIVDLANGQIYKAEALIRWLHPERGMINPLSFIALAEETGLIVPIGDWVFKQAVEQARRWRSRFHEAFQISVNMSPIQIRHDDIAFVQWPEYLQQHGMPGQSISIEITEGLLLNAETSINEKLLAFRDAGIQVSIDDFGTGYSSLAYLKRFDIDYLKIDRSFVYNLDTDADNQALCEAIIMMAHKLGLKVVAEGVETASQRDFLRTAGCDYAQGYLYSKPVPAEQFEQWAWADSLS